MPLVKEGSGVVNDVCTRVLVLYVILGIKSSDYRMARQATGVSVGSGEGVSLYVSACERELALECCVCVRWQGVRLKGQKGDLLVLYSCNLLRSDQPDPIMQHWAKYQTALSSSLTSLSLSESLCAPPPPPSLFTFHCSGSQLCCRGKNGVKMEREKERQARKSWEDGWWEMEIGLRKGLRKQRRRWKVDGTEQ